MEVISRSSECDFPVCVNGIIVPASWTGVLCRTSRWSCQLLLYCYTALAPRHPVLGAECATVRDGPRSLHSLVALYI